MQAGVEHFSERYLRLYGFEPGDVDATPEAFDARTHPDDLAPFIHAHPTQSEALGEAFLALAGKPLHAL